MASGFGCLVIGPAGSGKVSLNIKLLNILTVYIMSCSIRKWRLLEEKL